MLWAIILIICALLVVWIFVRLCVDLIKLAWAIVSLPFKVIGAIVHPFVTDAHTLAVERDERIRERVRRR